MTDFFMWFYCGVVFGIPAAFIASLPICDLIERRRYEREQREVRDMIRKLSFISDSYSMSYRVKPNGPKTAWADTEVGKLFG